LATVKYEWWRKPVRVIQTNLQVADTAKIEPERLVAEIEEMGADVLVFNVGGIYAWYRTEVPFHTINSFLPKDRDLLGEVIEVCHRRHIRFVARFDFSKAADVTWLRRPWWFVRDRMGNPQVIGATRPGGWPLLMSTCINSGYRNHEVAVPILQEALTRYDIDGVFYNNPGYIPCYCETCQSKYRKEYGKPMPENPDGSMGWVVTEWSRACARENLANLYKAVKSAGTDIPVIVYSGVYSPPSDGVKTADLVCTEPQNVLSRGHRDIPESSRPSLSIEIARHTCAGLPPPFGIVHSCPGMDWRHTGLPTADYLFWLSQIPANGGRIWHSITGIPETITDRRIIRTVSDFNAMVGKVKPYLEGATPIAQTGLLWGNTKSAKGWIEGLVNTQIPFSLIMSEQLCVEKLKGFRVVVVPNEWPYQAESVGILKKYVENGGNLIVEGSVPTEHTVLMDLLGINPEPYQLSESLLASYLRFEGDHNPLQLGGLEKTQLICLRGRVAYCSAKEDTKVLLTLVPPFSPLESVGAPPERASLPVSHTDVPMGLLSQYGKGKVVYFPFQLSFIINEFRLNEHYLVLSNAIRMLLGKDDMISVSRVQGLQVTVLQTEQGYLINLVNGVGSRPLVTNVPLRDIEIKAKFNEGCRVKSVRQLINSRELDFRRDGCVVEFSIAQLDVWEAVSVVVEV
jgi:hypothetical protein